MNRLFIILPFLLLAACTLSTTPEKPLAPAGKIYNEQCLKHSAFKIIQIGTDYTLLRTDNGYGDQFVIKTSEITEFIAEPYDDEIFFVSGGKRYVDYRTAKNEQICIALDGTYKYVSVTGAGKTVRKLTFVSRWLEDPTYTKK